MSGGSDTPTASRTTHDADACVVRSDDGARTWREVADRLPAHMRHNVEAMALASHPAGFTLFAANTAGEVYASDNQGDTWQRIASGLPPISKARHYFARPKRLPHEAPWRPEAGPRRRVAMPAARLARRVARGESSGLSWQKDVFRSGGTGWQRTRALRAGRAGGHASFEFRLWADAGPVAASGIQGAPAGRGSNGGAGRYVRPLSELQPR